MKLVYIYGDDRDKIKERISFFKTHAHKKKLTIYEVDHSNYASLNSKPESLFETKNILFINSNNIKLSNTAVLLEQQIKNEEIIIVYWFKKLTKLESKALPIPSNTECFTLPWIFYKVLDQYVPGNFPDFYSLYLKSLQENAVELFFGLFYKHIRQMYQACKVPESLGYPAWRLTKLISQADKWGEKMLKQLLSDLVQIDIKTKTSRDSLDDLLPSVFIASMKKT